MPLFSTPTQFAVLALLLVAGWLFGLASHPGGRKWKARYVTEREAHAAHRKDAEARIAAERARIAELERENARLARVVPVTEATIGSRDPARVRPIEPVDRRPIATTAASPAYPTGARRGWFEFNR